MKKYLFIAIIILAGVVFATSRACSYYQQEAARHMNNFDAVKSEMNVYKTKSGHSAASVQALNLKVKEFEKHYSELAAKADDLSLQNKRLLSASQTRTVTEYRIVTEWKDSIIVKEGRIDTLRCIEYKDKYLTFSFCDTDKAEPFIQHRDAMAQFVHRVPKYKIWFVRIGTKGIRQDVVFENPRTNIEFTEFIYFKK